jgi:hypothetical protein
MAMDAIDEKRIVRAYQLALGREPTIRETAAAKTFFQAQEKTIDLHKTQSAEAAFVADKMPQRDGQSASFSPKSEQNHFEVPHHKLFPGGDFTIEAFVLPKSVYETGSVRTIAAKWDGDVKHPGWSFGITGKKSRRKPQTVVMQIFGKKLDGSFGEAAVFSDQSVQLHKPYFISVVVELARDGKEGKLTFHIKDLSNDDEPLLTATTTHEIVGDFANELPFTIGGRTKGESYFDGLIDDVRLSSEPLSAEQLLFTSEGVKQNTIGYWQFEAKPDVLHDSSPNALHIQPTVHKVTTPNDVHRTAWRDFCHVLLNSNEFLYTE